MPTADQRPFGELLLGGEVRKLRFGFAAMANLASLGDTAVQRAFGMLSGRTAVSGGIAIECLAFEDLIWAALRVRMPGLKHETVSLWLDAYAADGGTLIDIWKVIQDGWDMPKAAPAPAQETSPADETGDRPTIETPSH